MNQETLLRAMQDVDPALLERSERKKRRYWPLAAAACLSLVLGLTGLYLGRPRDGLEVETAPAPSTQQTTVLAATESTEPCEETTEVALEYNQAELMQGDYALAQWLCIFGEALTDQESSVLLPENWPAALETSGYASYLGDGTLLWVTLTVTDPTWGGSATVQLRDVNQIEPPTDVLFLEENVVATMLNGASVIARECATDAGLFLWAEFVRDDLEYNIHVDTTQEQSIEAKALLQTLAELYTAAETVPDLSCLASKNSDLWLNEELALDEAVADVDFGAYMPREVPAGWQEEGFSRYRGQDQDRLSALWTSGYDSLRWTVSYLTDESRIVDVNCLEQYDLSLYPIPRAESVPEELWEMVDNPIFCIEDLTLELIYTRAYTVDDAGDSDGYRMRFSVLYGDTVVEVSTKGVSPEWLWEQLKDLG